MLRFNLFSIGLLMIFRLNKVQEETKGVSLSQMFMRIAKPRITFSSKYIYFYISYKKIWFKTFRVQFICSVLNLFLNQQQTSVGQLPRLKSSPVLNSRIQAFTELKNQKLQQELKLSPAEYNRLFDEITPFFKQSDLYNLNHADQLFNLLTHHLFPHEMIFKWFFNIFSWVTLPYELNFYKHCDLYITRHF